MQQFSNVSMPFLSQPCARPGLRFWSPLKVATCPMECWGSAVGGVADDLGIKYLNLFLVPYFILWDWWVFASDIFRALFVREFRVPIARCRSDHGWIQIAVMAINSQLVGKMFCCSTPFPFTLQKGLWFPYLLENCLHSVTIPYYTTMLKKNVLLDLVQKVSYLPSWGPGKVPWSQFDVAPWQILVKYFVYLFCFFGSSP